MQTEASVGRPPLPDHKKRNIRKTTLFNQKEWDEVEAYLEAEGEGITDLMRDATLDKVRDNQS